MTKFNDAVQNIPNLKVESVAKALNWCWLVDFGQGNFAQAKLAAEIAILNNLNPDTLMVRAIVHQLQGEYHQALSLLATAFNLASNEDQKLIIATFAHLTEQKAQETLADNFAVSLNLNSASIWLKRILALKDSISDINLRLESNFLEQVAKILPYFRTLLVRQNNFGQKERYSQKIQDKLTRQLEIYQNAEIYVIAALLYTVFAQILSLAGQIKPAWELVNHLTQAYGDSQKFLEAGWFSLNQGDLVITINSWGQPITFGYSIAEVITNPQSPRKFNRSTLDTATAQRLYSQARDYFSQAQAPRGEAMAIMRLAYLNGVNYQWNLAAFGYREARQYFAQTGDFLNVIAAEMGYLWSSLQYKPLDSDLIATIQQWTQWSQKQGAISWGMSWSFAFALAAEEALVVNQEIEVALRLLEVAEIIALNLDIFKSVNSSASYHKLWQSCLLLLANISRQLIEKLVLTNSWQKAFIISEKIKIYETRILNNYYDEYFLNSVATIDNISQKLRYDVLVIAYFVIDRAILFWAITQQGLVKTHIWRNIDPQYSQIDFLNKIIVEWLENLFEYSDFESNYQNILEQIFIQPFLQEIKNHHHLIIISCNQIHFFPISALQVSGYLENKKSFLGLLKSISYSNKIHNISRKTLNSSPNKKVLIVTERGDILDNQFPKRIISESPEFSLNKALILAIIELYNFSKIYNYRQENVKTVQIFLSSKNLSIAPSMVQELAAELAIINIEDINLKQSPTIKLKTLTQQILTKTPKTVVIILQGKFAITTAMLTFFFHQKLSQGHSVAQSLDQAQKRISSIKASEAIDFCRSLQSHIAWKNDSDHTTPRCQRDRAIRGLITKYMGDILVLGGEYIQAGKAYEAAINIFYGTGYIAEARTLEENYKLFNSFPDIPQQSYRTRPIFQAPINWNNGFIFGDFTLQNVTILRPSKDHE